jgi:hypothetical protein
MKKKIQAQVHDVLVEAIDALATRMIRGGYFVTPDEAIEHALYFGIANLRALTERIERESARARSLPSRNELERESGRRCDGVWDYGAAFQMARIGRRCEGVTEYGSGFNRTVVHDGECCNAASSKTS